MLSPPTGTVTFLFTDIEGSTRQWENHPREMAQALARHDTILRESIEQQGGYVFKTVGDAFFASFARPADAVTAAIQAQRSLRAESWSEHTPIRVRMAMHTGAVESRNNDYFGPPLNRVARLLAVAHGGQTLLSDAAKELTRGFLPPDVHLQNLGSHALKDLPEPEVIWQVLHPDLPGIFPPLRVVPSEVHGLPQTLSAFIGREREAEELEHLLRQPSIRLVTLTGFGGMGKSRLAMEVARRCLLLFPEGVWWIDLDVVTSGDLLFTRLAERLHLPLSPNTGIREQIYRALHERNTLFILDNLEQIPDAAEAVRDLLAAAPGVTCLVTTQRVLGLRGERVLELHTLPDSDAVTLFADRARDVRTDFLVDDHNRSDVEDLCRRLEGVPLAIELAAARCTVLTPRQIIARLSERFRLLQSRSPDLPLRQRTLLATLEWSFNLLPPDEQAVLAQLSVFAGGFSLDDAEAVCDAFDVLESIDILRRHSLLHTETNPETQETRFLMLESVREFGAERLRSTNEDTSTYEQRHSEHFLQVGREQLARLRTTAERAALLRLEADADNLRAALKRSSGRLPIYAELALVVGRWRHRRGFLRDAETAVQDGIDALQPWASEYPSLWAELLRERAGLHLDFGEIAAAEEKAGAARECSAAYGDAEGEGKAENLLGQAAMKSRDFDAARADFERALIRLSPDTSPVESAILYNNLGLVEYRDAAGRPPEERDARLERAESHLNEALRLRQEYGDERGLAETLNNMGVVAFAREDWERAETFYKEALIHEQTLRNTFGMAVLLYNLGEVAQRRADHARETGEYPRAVRLLTVSERFFEEAQSPIPDIVRETLSQVMGAAQMTSEALDSLRTAIRALPAEERIPFAVSKIGDFSR